VTALPCTDSALLDCARPCGRSVRPWRTVFIDHPR
jgi:hypothetical protein